MVEEKRTEEGDEPLLASGTSTNLILFAEFYVRPALLVFGSILRPIWVEMNSGGGRITFLTLLAEQA